MSGKRRRPENDTLAEQGKVSREAPEVQKLSTSKPEAESASSAARREAGSNAPATRGTDKDSHLAYEPNESLTPRYKILGKVGEGTFGRVLECWDRTKKDYVAIKVIRKCHRDNAMIEIDVLKTIAKADPKQEHHCLYLRDWFDFKGHICIVFDKLGLSLYDFLRKNHYKPFSLDLVRKFGLQLLESVACLHDLTLVHTDLKPENILLVSAEYTRERMEPAGPSSSEHREGSPGEEGCRKSRRVEGSQGAAGSVGRQQETSTSKPGQSTRESRLRTKRVPKSHEIKLIDFGSATFESQHHSSVVSTRHYRAPEVILGLGWTYPCDVWSVGCILVELTTGDALFQTHENLEHLAMMEAVLGPIPPEMIQLSGKPCHKYFCSSMTKLNWPEGASSCESIRAVRNMYSLNDTLLAEGSSGAHLALVDLVKGLLRYDPKDRMTARSALDHPFFDPEKPNKSSTSAPPSTQAPPAETETPTTHQSKSTSDRDPTCVGSNGSGGDCQKAASSTAVSAVPTPSPSTHLYQAHHHPRSVHHTAGAASTPEVRTSA